MKNIIRYICKKNADIAEYNAIIRYICGKITDIADYNYSSANKSLLVIWLWTMPE
jgi:hypothetical protein